LFVAAGWAQQGELNDGAVEGNFSGVAQQAAFAGFAQQAAFLGVSQHAAAGAQHFASAVLSFATNFAVTIAPAARIIMQKTIFFHRGLFTDVLQPLSPQQL
jgi:hypothetical protein